jgi:hypothetical protein
MSGFLSNLLSRSRGTADVVRPRLASMFEPQSFNEAAGEWESEVEAREEMLERDSETERRASPSVPRNVKTPYEPVPEKPKASPPERQEPQPAPRLPEEKVAMVPRPRALEEAPRQAEQRPSQGSEFRAREARARQRVLTPLSAASPPKVNSLVVTSLGQQQREPRAPAILGTQVSPSGIAQPAQREEPTPSLALPPPRAQSLIPPPGRPRFDPAPTAQRIGAAAEPSVQVTIGRIEVRAVNEAAPQEKTHDHSPVMSLDEYLKARARGASR